MALVAVVAIYVSWRAERRYRAELATELNATKQALEAADARQRTRDSRLAETLAAIAAEKQTVKSPAQIVKDLPRQMPLPVPIMLQDTGQNGGRIVHSGVSAGRDGGTLAPKGSTSSDEQDASKVQAVIPGQDLKPLYDFALDCKACQAKLATSQSDLADERGKTLALAVAARAVH